MKSKAKCPKCKSVHLIITEVWKNHTIEFDQDSGIVDRENGNLDAGYPYKVEARCKWCGFTWTIRGARQIDDLKPQLKLRLFKKQKNI